MKKFHALMVYENGFVTTLTVKADGKKGAFLRVLENVHENSNIQLIQVTGVIEDDENE